MWRYADGHDRAQSVLSPEWLDDGIRANSTDGAIDVFVDEPDRRQLGFDWTQPAAIGRQAHSPATLAKIQAYGYLNRLRSSRRLGTEAQGNLELIRLGGRLAPGIKTIADFRRDSGESSRKVCGVGLRMVRPESCCEVRLDSR